MTLVELLIAVAIIGIITPAILALLVTLINGFTGYEAATQLRITNQSTLNRIYLRLGSCKRIFQNIAADTAYLNRIVLTGCPPVLSGSALPVIQSTGTLNFGSPDFITADVGNSLFFANYEGTVILTSTITVRIDTFRFNYYYLSAQNPKSIKDRASYAVEEWRSIAYADMLQLQSYTGALKTSLIKELYSKGYTYGWDTSASAVGSAFWSFSSNGTVTAVQAHQISKFQNTVLTKMLTGIIIGGYNYGVSANSSGWTNAPKKVPVYAVAAGSFPSGFEVAIGGSSSGRIVLIRSVLVAQGNFKNIIGDDLEQITSARDLW